MGKDWLQFYFSFKGRATRYDFNVRCMLPACVGAVIAWTADYLIFGSDALFDFSFFRVSRFWTMLSFIPVIAVSCRRLHDMDRSMLAFFWPLASLSVVNILMKFLFLPNIESLIGMPGIIIAVLIVTAILVFLAIIASVWLFFMLHTKRGTIGPNKYGNDPLEADNV